MHSEEQSISELVKQMETSWNSGDSKSFSAVFAEDADFVDILGRYHHGRTTIEAGHRQIFDTIYRGSRNHYTVERVRFVGADVAVAFVRARLLSRLGVAVDRANRDLLAEGSQAMSEAQARPTLVLAKHRGEWKVVAFQNTKIAE